MKTSDDALDALLSESRIAVRPGFRERVMAATGRIDLVHANDSKDPFDSRRDRHQNLGHGEIPPDELSGVICDADAPVVVETPGEAADQAADIEWVRSACVES